MRSERVRKIVRASVALGAAAGTMAVPACLDRPVTPVSPQTSNIFVSAIPQNAIDKIDLLFVVDNSISMADKQDILAAAVPELLTPLIDPAPVDGKLPFKPVRDIHIGVISSSLGGHGAAHCSPSAANATVDDKAHLIGTLQSSSPARASAPAGFDNLGFLAWDPDNRYGGGGESDLGALITSFREQVKAVGEQGCGYEATLEAWYRFLVDPNPPAEVVVENGQAVARGTDEALLAQRRAFLRPDSLVAIIMLTDENDCSIMDGGIGWMSAEVQQTGSGAPFSLPRSTSACATDPNSACCQSCGTLAPHPDCAALPSLDAIARDPECQKGLHDTTSDHPNLRCWEQKRRFGIDFLYPTSRYVDALKSRKVRDRDGVEHDNPLFVTSGATPRDPDLVYLAGIVGVPWQDVATPETLDAPDALEYQRAEDIRWDWIVGDPNTQTKPLDPLMHEQPEPRSGVNPAKGYPIAPATSLDPFENPINGHEYTTSQDDLQYACIFPLESPRDCTADTSCDCISSFLDANKPLCQPLTGGPAELNQYFAKGYPGLRHLQVLEDFGKNSIVASICPKVVDNTKPSYGYNPAVSAITDRLRDALTRECLPRKLVPEDDPTSPDYEKVPCEVVEARRSNGEACTCDAARGTSELTSSDAQLADAVKKQLAELGTCGGSTGIACSDVCLCSINQLTGAALDACQAGTPTDPGYCYIDQEIADRNRSAILEECEETKKQVLSFVGDNVPAKGSITFIACAGATFGGT